MTQRKKKMCKICSNEVNENSVIQTLDCSNCPDLIEIPMIKNLRELKCRFCPNLTKIPRIPSLEFMDCSYCEKLKTIESLNLIELHCAGCHGIIKINDFKKLITLDCTFCQNLAEIRGNDNLRNLTCVESMGIRELEIPGLQTLDCSSTCVTKISSYDPKKINCSYCPYLNEISISKDQDRNLEELFCHHCISLKELPANLKKLQKLDCSSCQQLAPIPQYENLKQIIS